MFFSGKEKKPGGSRVLSEAEIKKKLYGDYETSSADMHSSTQEVKMSGTAFESQAAGKRHSSSGAAIRSPSFGAASKPETLVARNAGIPFSEPSFRNSSSAHKQIPSVSSGVNFSGDWKSSSLHAAQAVLGFLAGLLWKGVSYLIRVLDFILRILDPRKPQARKLLYSITACCLVAALFFGVFRLNSQRKKAMSGELRTESAGTIAAAKQASVKQAVSAESAVSRPVDSQQDIQKEESQESILKALENSRADAPVAKRAADTSATSRSEAAAGKYVIQVATYAAAEDANHIVQAFSKAGFSAFSKKQIRNSTGHLFYPVYLGRFESFVTAQQALAKFRKASVARPFQDSFIRTLE